jgi:hypothetical protein
MVPSSNCACLCLCVCVFSCFKLLFKSFAGFITLPLLKTRSIKLSYHWPLFIAHVHHYMTIYIFFARKSPHCYATACLYSFFDTHTHTHTHTQVVCPVSNARTGVISTCPFVMNNMEWDLLSLFSFVRFRSPRTHLAHLVSIVYCISLSQRKNVCPKDKLPTLSILAVQRHKCRHHHHLDEIPHLNSDICLFF